MIAVLCARITMLSRKVQIRTVTSVPIFLCISSCLETNCCKRRANRYRTGSGSDPILCSTDRKKRDGSCLSPRSGRYHSRFCNQRLSHIQHFRGRSILHTVCAGGDHSLVAVEPDGNLNVD